MRKLQKQNMALNNNQLKRRKDGAIQSCTIINPYDKQVEKPRRKTQDKKYTNYMSQPQKEVVLGQRMEEDYFKTATIGYEDEDLLDEARTNEEMFDDNLIQAQLMLGKGKGIENCVFFNECEDDDESNNQSSNESEDEGDEEDGEFDPSLHAQVLADGEEY